MVAERAVLFEEHLEAALAAGRAALDLGPGPRGGSSSTSTAISARWVWPPRPQRCFVAFRARRSPIWTPAAAAWRDRSAIPSITTTCRRPSGSGSSCRPRAASAEGAVLAAAGTSCRHQVQHFTGVQATTPRRPHSRFDGKGARMSLAWISLLALAIAITLSMFTQVNVGVVSLALAWLVGVYLGGIPLNTVIGTFPIQLFLTLAGVTLLFGMAAANGTLGRVASRAVHICRGNAGGSSR